MDQAIRNKLRSVVTQCRRLLEESIAQQLQGRFDIYATGKKDEVKAEEDVPLGHLTEEERQARQDILAHFKHIEALGYKRKETLEQLIREIAFTHLNRLCAYKMMEVRDVYVGGQKFREAVSKGLKSQGFLFYLAEHPEDEKRYNAGQHEEAYRHFLNWLGGTLSQEIGVLFSPTDPANRVYPPQRVLDEVLDLLNSEELKGIWSEDETIGWVYQYFTPKELRDQARKESQAPRNSYELAFRNQFFTPRYVVEFLTDNTLGRIWYEMRKGNTRLKDECRYMVRRPGEVFFTEQENEPGSPVMAMKDLLLGGTEETFPPFHIGETERVVVLAHTVDGYERHPTEDQVEGEWWPWAKLREIREAGDLSRFPSQDLLDVLFCQARADRFGGGYGDWDEIFYDIANEVRRRAIEGLKEDATQEQLLRAITAITHRPKKDPREIKILDPACGSGHFLLYCFALLLVIYEEAYDDPELGPVLQADYPTKDDLRRAVPGLILRHNLHGIDIDLRCTQIAALALWLRCQRAYQEMGLKKDRPRITKSNIVCAEPMPGEGQMLKEFVAQIEPKLLGQLAEVVFEKMKLAGEAGSLLKIEEEIRDAVAEARKQWRIGPVATQMRLFGEQTPVERQQRFDLSGITDAQFFEQTEAKVVEALRNYAERAQNGQRLQRRLFADDAVRGFAFVDLCHKQFDVVLMNPPFGDASKSALEVLDIQLADSGREMGGAFVAAANSRWAPSGFVGAVISSASLFQPTFTKWRRQNLFGAATSLSILGHLGGGVLDEATVSASALVMTNPGTTEAVCFRLIRCAEKQETLLDSVESMHMIKPTDITSVSSLSDLASLAGSPLAYWISKRLITHLARLRSLEGNGASVRQGVATADEFRFSRAWWEAPSNSTTWTPYTKSSEYSPFWDDATWVINYENDGHQLRETGKAVIRGAQYFGLPGITFPSRSVLGFNPRVHPSGCIFSHTGSVAFPDRGEVLALLGLLASRPVEYVLSLLVGSLQGEAGSHPLHYEVGVLQRLPIPYLPRDCMSLLQEQADSCVQVVRGFFSHDETSHDFEGFSDNQAISSRGFAESLESQERAAFTSLLERRAGIDQVVCRAYGFSESDLHAMEEEFAARIPPASGRWRRYFGVTPDPTDATTIACSILSYAVGTSLGRWDLRVPTKFLFRTFEGE